MTGRLAAGPWVAASALALSLQLGWVPLEEVPAGTVAHWQAALDEWAGVPGHFGVSAAVMLADGREWAGVAGKAGIEGPLRPDHLILIASITKTMTGAVVLQLVDEGVLRLDDPIERWLAPRPNIGGGITIRQLLNHTNGLANYTISAALGSVIDDNPMHVFTPDELLGFTGPPSPPDDAQAHYTNTAFVVLGQIAEAATGRPIVDLYHQRLWAPLGLTEIFLPGYETPPGAGRSSLSGRRVVSPLDRMALLTIGHSAFGLMASARTITRWGHALFAGDVVSADMQDAMRTLVPAAGTIPDESGVGLGIRGYAFHERIIFGHSGGSSFGSSLLLFDPESGVTVTVLMNQGQGAHHFVLAPALLDIAVR